MAGHLAIYQILHIGSILEKWSGGREGKKIPDAEGPWFPLKSGQIGNGFDDNSSGLCIRATLVFPVVVEGHINDPFSVAVSSYG